ncbi:hypothetical protein [Paraglaciecola sp.]|uniref:hypothetical protein n=1 Tax=Paraglaciecola sp. TaxID=1920173 RepID=UPI0030F39BBB
MSKQQQLDILRQEVGKGFRQLSKGQTSDKSALDIFAQVSQEIMANYKLSEFAKSFPAQKHMVYYWKSSEGIEVARILHQRMDVLAAFE